MTLQKLKTNKLFYGKWPYKLTVVQQGCWTVRYAGIPLARTWNGPGWATAFDLHSDRVKFIRFLDALEPFVTQDIQMRVERNTLNLYCKNKELLEQMSINLAEWAKELHEPASQDELEFIMNQSSKKLLCSQLPHTKYQYKVYFKQTTSPDVKIKFASWISNYKDSIKTTKSAQNWLLNKSWMYNPFVYVDSKSTLSMVILFLGNNVQKIEEYIVRDSINTSSY
jgi:hypothetical protein